MFNLFRLATLRLMSRWVVGLVQGCLGISGIFTKVLFWLRLLISQAQALVDNKARSLMSIFGSLNALIGVFVLGGRWFFSPKPKPPEPPANPIPPASEMQELRIPPQEQSNSRGSITLRLHKEAQKGASSGRLTAPGEGESSAAGQDESSPETPDEL